MQVGSFIDEVQRPLSDLQATESSFGVYYLTRVQFFNTTPACRACSAQTDSQAFLFALQMSESVSLCVQESSLESNDREISAAEVRP